MKSVSKYNPLNYYQWGTGCHGWVLLDTPKLSVKQEKMASGTAEILHYHEQAQQFFFILTGIATFEVDEEFFSVTTGQGFHIPPGKIHRIINNTSEDVEFMLSSQPSTNNDRYNCV